MRIRRRRVLPIIGILFAAAMLLAEWQLGFPSNQLEWLVAKYAADLVAFHEWLRTGLVAFFGFIFIAPVIVDTWRGWFLVGEHPAIKRLSRRRRIQFRDIAATLAPTENLSSDDIMQRLLRALWRGDFENLRGHSRLTAITGGGYARRMDGRYVDGEHEPVAEPPRKEWTRRALLIGMSPTYAVSWPSNNVLGNNSISWRRLRKQLPLKVLEGVSPQELGDINFRAYIAPLEMSPVDFRRWLRRYRRGSYEE